MRYNIVEYKTSHIVGVLEKKTCKCNGVCYVGPRIKKNLNSFDLD